MKRRSFKPEFKKEAAILVLDEGYTVSEACDSLGVSNGAIRKWVSQLQEERSGNTPTSSKALTTEHREIQELKARIKQLEMEKDILKKATALLVKDEIKFTR